MDARTYRREFEVRKLTVKDVVEAVEKMRQIPTLDRYFFHTDWVKPYASEEDCIQYFAGNRSVIVVDHQGRQWHLGKQINAL